jgi:hypothetical protein
LILIGSSTPLYAEDVVSIYGQDCKHGIHKQAKGPFAMHVFCDSALGTNIAIYMDFIGAPLFGNYYLGKRFWQGEEWNYDVTSYSWLKENKLLIATSGIYGSGAVYILKLENQTLERIRAPDEFNCITKLKAVENRRATIGLTNCKTLQEQLVDVAL